MQNQFIFLDASVELVPKAIADHPAILADAARRKKKPREIILEDSKHHAAMKKLKNKEKRGRPDIIHQCLLLLLDSPFKYDFDVYIHTISGNIIWVNNKTRIPRNYNRFLGLLEDLFKKEIIVSKDGEVLLEKLNLKLSEVIGERTAILLSEKGRKNGDRIKELFREKFSICIGAFPHGDFSPEVIRNLKNLEIISLGKNKYTSLYVTSKILCIYEGVRTTKNCKRVFSRRRC